MGRRCNGEKVKPSSHRPCAWLCCRSIEVYALLLVLYALVVGPFRQWRASVVATLAAITSVLVYLTNE